jgi:hypothetical protein
MTEQLPFEIPNCIALCLEPNFVIPLVDAKDDKDERIDILKKKLLLVGFKSEEIKVKNMKEEKKDKLYFYHNDFFGLPILLESPKLNWFSLSKEKAAA